MTWVRIDDTAPHHPKMLRAGPDACWLWLSGLAYSNAHRLDGRISKDLLLALYPPFGNKAKALAAKLVTVGLWHDHADFYEIHDYHEFQEQALKETVQARRDYERDRKREQRSRDKPQNVPGDVPENVPDKTGTLSAPVPSVTRADPVPSRPVPSEEREKNAAPPSLPSSAAQRDPTRHRFELEETVRAEFFARDATPQKASVTQWRDGCQTVDDALRLKAFPNAQAAITAFSKLLVDACARGEKLGFALQQTNLGAQLEESEPPTTPEETPRAFW